VDGFAEQDFRIFLFAQHLTQRPGNVGRRQRACRDLIKQRLEQMVVAAVDQRHLDRRAF
jgi:hypothetical protein